MIGNLYKSNISGKKTANSSENVLTNKQEIICVLLL